MGGDYAPGEIVQGAVEAALRGDVKVLLVGEQEALKGMVPVPALPTLEVIFSQGVITEAEHPVEALRHKPRASIAVAAGLVKVGKADGYVTMGSTGAAMAAGMVALGTLKGVDRPALGGPFLGLAPKTTVIDLGTSVDCRPSQLLNYGVLGSVFSKVFLGIENPRVALLSVGAEEGKGNRQVRETYPLFQKSGLNFIGNVEGMDVPLGKADVVVCDGFVGNVLMKFAEGLGLAVVQYLKARVSREGPEVASELLRELTNLTNLVEHRGGGPLLGLNGVAVVGHGRSRAPSVTAAIDMACMALERGLVDMMRRELTQVQQRVQV
ncbi:MAG: Phosphate acyltransferase [Dehalococcoidia bacterium]|nr:Phosphate acyltransferase [Dehalococcoidia bacterium]